MCHGFAKLPGALSSQSSLLPLSLWLSSPLLTLTLSSPCLPHGAPHPLHLTIALFPLKQNALSLVSWCALREAEIP